jgi:hypothetical protein
MGDWWRSWSSPPTQKQGADFGETLYLRTPHPLRPATTTVTVPLTPTRAGIDGYPLVIDLETETMSRR